MLQTKKIIFIMSIANTRRAFCKVCTFSSVSLLSTTIPSMGFIRTFYFAIIASNNVDFTLSKCWNFPNCPKRCLKCFHHSSRFSFVSPLSITIPSLGLIRAFYSIAFNNVDFTLSKCSKLYKIWLKCPSRL